MLASAVVVETLVDVVAGLLLTSHHLEPDARVVGVVDQVDPQVSGLDGLGQVHDGHGGAVQDSELDRRIVHVSEFSHLVGVVVGVHQPDGGREGKLTVGTKNSLNTEPSEKLKNIFKLSQMLKVRNCFIFSIPFWDKGSFTRK